MSTISDKLAAYQTVHECLIVVSQMMSPIAPFFGEWLYGMLMPRKRDEESRSVHFSMFPEVDPERD